MRYAWRCYDGAFAVADVVIMPGICQLYEERSNLAKACRALSEVK